MFKTLNAITDGIVAAVIIFISILLNLIAILCIRFTILAAIEEDIREIGVLKAIGIRLQHIKHIYVLKYFVIAALAAVTGYMISLLLYRSFNAQIMLYMGTAEKSLFLRLIPLIIVFIVFLLFQSFPCYNFESLVNFQRLRLCERALEKQKRSCVSSLFTKINF
ncbi:FtsX-like permease family protein [Bacillus sp. N9]